MITVQTINKFIMYQCFISITTNYSLITLNGMNQILQLTPFSEQFVSKTNRNYRFF